MNEYEGLTYEELTEVYIMLNDMLVPYIKSHEHISQYQVCTLVDAIRKIGLITKGKEE